MTLAIWAHFLQDKLDTGRFVNSIVERNFAGSAYYWMFPFKRYMIKKFYAYHDKRMSIPEIQEVLNVIEKD